MRPRPTLQSLPSELLHAIFSHLPPADLLNVAAVSTTLRASATARHLWLPYAPSSHDPRHAYLLSCAWRSARPLRTETLLLTHVPPHPHPHPHPSHTLHLAQAVPTNVARFPVQCIHYERDGSVIVGTSGGEVIRVAYPSLSHQSYVGPCSCPVTAVSANEHVVIAGFAHCVPGNGHTSAAVAWERVTGHRLAAFGGGSVRSSWAFPTAAVRHVVVSDHRVALVCGSGLVKVFEIGRWTCLLEICEGYVVRVDMDDARLGIVAMNQQGGQVLHLLDFEKALTMWPREVERIQAR